MKHIMKYGTPQERQVYEAVAGALNGETAINAAGTIALFKFELDLLYKHIMGDEVDSDELVTITTESEADEAEEPAEEPETKPVTESGGVF